MNHNYFKPQSRRPTADEKWLDNDPGTEITEDFEKYLEEIIMDPQYFIF
ncbi:hypothetical protein ASZ90_017098 [hydrocarbon metagenome]|uniref:Uncharacterized protein n=1 Tax=hydrocarbon metagenome TaxID=938273 RepID=A0A0W8E9X0_9ZZZZ